MPGPGAGLPVDQNVRPVAVSTAAGNQTPAPLLTSGSPQKPGAIVRNSQATLPSPARTP